MTIRRINANDGAAPVGAYVQALEVKDTTRRLYVSGQAPMSKDGTVPGTLKEQAEVV